MCRRIVIDCTWDSDNEQEDAADAFDLTTTDKLNPEFAAKLQDLFENNFVGGLWVNVMELPAEARQ